MWLFWCKNILTLNCTMQQWSYAWNMCILYVIMCVSSSFHLPPLIPVMFPIHPLFFYYPVFIFYPCQPSFPFPDATKVKQEQCSVPLHLSCRNKMHRQLCNAKKAWMKQRRRDTEAWGGWIWNEEHASASCILPSQHAQTILLFHSNEGIITAHKCTRTTCQSAQSECPKTRPMSGAQK